MIWEVGGYISHKLKNAEWGAGIVRQLSEFIRTQDPTIKGWSYRTIYKMVQFYDTYSNASFIKLIEKTKLSQLTPLTIARQYKTGVCAISNGTNSNNLIFNRLD